MQLFLHKNYIFTTFYDNKACTYYAIVTGLRLHV